MCIFIIHDFFRKYIRMSEWPVYKGRENERERGSERRLSEGKGGTLK
jgi:hypothetical protein